MQAGQDVRHMRENPYLEKTGGKHLSFVSVLPGRVAQKASQQGILFWSIGSALPLLCQKQRDEQSSVLEQAEAQCCVQAAVHTNEGRENELFYNETKVHLGVSFFSLG